MAESFASRTKTEFVEGHDAAASERFWSSLDVNSATSLRQQQALINAVVSGSPYLASLLLQDAAFAVRCITEVPEHLLHELLSGIDLESAEATATDLRKRKPCVALLTALADSAGVWSVVQVTEALTAFADVALQATVNTLLLEAAAQGKLLDLDIANPTRHCGFVVLAMGKHGARELNYSSDIDLIVLYDPDAATLAPDVEPATFFVKLTRRMVALLQDITAEGYVFRVDLRLRPDPRATQVAIAMEAAANYYEYQGQNWERAAYIKARAVAGDIACGEDFLARLVPYVWRKYLDFAAISDVQSLIRQIHAVKGHGEIAVEGHNIKLGRGGIREIEFFVQTQQLIAGGRNTALRGRRTCDMLDGLATANWIAPVAAAELKQAYEFLRMIEHRAQMVDDQQTHLLPKDEERFANFARFCNFQSAAALRLAVRTTLETVQRHSSKLFESADKLAGAAGSLVFTGGEDDPETLLTLEKMGFSQASEISAIIRSWHFGRYAATRDKRARESLTELMPILLAALAASGDADRTLHGFDGFLKGLPAGVQVLAMMKANPDLLTLLTQILGMAPRLAEGLSQQPRIMEAVLERGFFDALPTQPELNTVLQQSIQGAQSLDEILDRVRVFAREQRFRVGVHVLLETVSAEAAGFGFSNIAEVALQVLLQAVCDEFDRVHGLIKGGHVAVVAMGKLGSREMTATSDLDLMLIYDSATDAETSDGAKPLSPQQYFARLAQRFITAISAPTAEGLLYDVDMRLRPSGSKGPVAVSLQSFVHYQADSAWVWEKLALSRARVVAGDASLLGAISTAIQHSLAAVRDAATTRRDVMDMRKLMLQQFKPGSPWMIKQVRGGLVEVEFIAQYLQLVHAAVHPAILRPTTFEALIKLREQGLVSAADSETLVVALQLYHRLTHLLRLCLDGDFEPTEALPGLTLAIIKSLEVPTLSAAEDLLRDTQAKVSEIFDRLIGQPV